jgi:hypothetical protein
MTTCEKQTVILPEVFVFVSYAEAAVAPVKAIPNRHVIAVCFRYLLNMFSSLVSFS